MAGTTVALKVGGQLASEVVGTPLFLYGLLQNWLACAARLLCGLMIV